MLAEGLFILTVSLSGNYNDLEFVGYFNDCPSAMVYLLMRTVQYKQQAAYKTNTSHDQKLM